MKYAVGLLIFSAIGSFVIADTITFWRDFRKTNSPSHLYVDFFRLVVLGGMASVGYLLASETFHQPNDQIIFLFLGIVGALLIRVLSHRLSHEARK